ncbi:ABC transporter ATP-binding protein [Parapusillimonas granuli]|uniref:ABC transporter ATP-binding protein n=1 Tax=Parapusillimonas granuli TaxID=380911 RepID=A0A853FQQ1_9BURK|nr:ABC transporter ATP-binding protein [Parapusillimonas granuli]MBB5216609.1 ABC-type Fe3+/spermidine/putrescine transport system ATPase subunit [Parapusillimonas granuli]MEB2399650.1 ABC transporter ATP-binding protein [Alcaligenaceae bacterium]NYT48085.1 ABC transporter ATP-binding protein [Parapusillimonas granuli]
MNHTYDLELSDVVKDFGGTRVVDRLNISIEKGEFISLLGPSGCGKSTTLMMIAGFEGLSDGQVKVRGNRIDHLLPERRNIGIVFQAYALFPHMSVRQNVEYGLKMRKVPAAERKSRAGKLLDLVHMTAFSDRYPRQLSGGQQQRVALARALVTEPSILLLDEPFSALDRQLREDLQREVRALQRSLGITTIFVTHDQDEALLMSDRIAVMNRGKVEQCAAPQNLYKSPATEFVARFIGRGTFLDGTAVAGGAAGLTIDTPIGQVQGMKGPDAGSKNVRLFFRPEDVTSDPVGEMDRGLAITGPVRAVYFQGASTTAEVLVAGLDAPLLFDASEMVRHRSLSEGDTLSLHVPRTKIHVFARQ